MPHTEHELTCDLARIVLDTNVVLDWLLFDDPDGREVGRAITSGTLRWIATRPMRDEHFGVLGRAVFARWAPDHAAQQRLWDAHCRLVDAPSGVRGATGLRCTDANDQMFVDLAVIERPRWLLTRDKALLSLALPLGLHGVHVANPAAWIRDRAAAESATA